MRAKKGEPVSGVWKSDTTVPKKVREDKDDFTIKRNKLLCQCYEDEKWLAWKGNLPLTVAQITESDLQSDRSVELKLLSSEELDICLYIGSYSPDHYAFGFGPGPEDHDVFEYR